MPEGHLGQLRLRIEIDAEGNLGLLLVVGEWVRGAGQNAPGDVVLHGHPLNPPTRNVPAALTGRRSRPRAGRATAQEREPPLPHNPRSARAKALVCGSWRHHWEVTQVTGIRWLLRDKNLPHTTKRCYHP